MAATLILSSCLNSRVGRSWTCPLLGGSTMSQLGYAIEYAASFVVEPWRVFRLGRAVSPAHGDLPELCWSLRSWCGPRRATIVAVESLVIGLFAWKVVADRRHSIHADAGGRHGARREDPSL